MASAIEPPAKRARPTSVEDVTQERVAVQDLGTKSGGMTLTVQEIATDKLTKLADSNWSSAARQADKLPAFDPQIVSTIYTEELGGDSDQPPSLKRIMLLEISQYLENYLWPNYDPGTASFEHTMSIILMVNEKFRENVPAWTSFHSRQDVFPDFFRQVLTLKEGRELRMHQRLAYLVFCINCFQSLEDEMVRTQVLRLVSLPLWHALSPGRLQLELHAQPALTKHWRHAAKKDAKAAGKPGFIPAAQRPENTFLPYLLQEFLTVVESEVLIAPSEEAMDASGPGVQPTVDARALLYCERFMELLTDLLSQLPTRRFVRTLLDDKQILVKCKMCKLYRYEGAHLYRQLVDLFQFYMAFPINDHTGDPLTEDAVQQQHYDKVCQLQRLFFKHWPQLRELSLLNCGAVERRETLKLHLGALNHDELRQLVCRQLRLVGEQDVWADNPAFLLEVMLSTYERRRSQRELINEMPLYPTEAVLWDESQVPSVNYTGEGCLALPKLNLQFLTPLDYLLRNFHLFRLEATYEIREDIQDVLGRVGASWDEDGEKVIFRGWARMGLPITAFKITEVRKPKVGENKPAAVTADVVIDTKALRGDVRSEWDQLKQHDVLFLITVRPPDEAAIAAMHADGRTPGVLEKYGVVYVRGCEVIEVKDEMGKLMNDFTGRVKREEWQPPQGFTRTLTLALDTSQYQLDINTMEKHKSEDPYGTFNLIIRRKPKENNFKAVLESIRDLMNEDAVIPDWLHDIFLGYGDPAAAGYHNMQDTLTTVDFQDTFLDAKHVEESFPSYSVRFTNQSSSEQPQPPFRITFPQSAAKDDGALAQNGDAVDAAENGGSSKAQVAAGSESSSGAKPELLVESYVPPDPGPFPEDQPPRNRVRFTPVQTEAIMSGVQPGLTMIVGPPGTGKTDTAVQIMNVLYHNCPGQRTLLITHSNQALNDLFQKILERDVPSRYLLRLGMGEQELETADDFSRVGRVNSMLARRLELLAEVEKMARQFGTSEDMAYTCETAAHFWLLHVLSRWERFVALANSRKDPEAVDKLFPFKEYFANAPQPLFKRHSYDDDMSKARGCFRHLKTIFQELEEIRPFELLKGQADRVNYLMTRQAKIVAMTCTHAAMKRREFLELAFKYDNLLMEESAQILEIETFIPMLLQRQEDGHSRLKRVVLIGDHHQLPPVVKNMAFQKYSHLDQSLFTRFIRLGTPYVELNAQGRARPSIAKLYNWRYRSLGDLPAVVSQPEYNTANAGFAFDYQFVNVPDYNGKGETEPIQYFYQNLGEAEYVVAVYQFMRLLGYPAEKITILTTYNGQKALLRDIIEQRCANNPMYGRPHRVSTVDKYQGQQNDYVLLSLVRTRVVGHLRDVRRLVVAMSRARLGLYVFGRQGLFANCFELQQTFKLLLQRPTQLALVKGESYAMVARKSSESVAAPDLIPGVAQLQDLVGRIDVEQRAARAMQH